MTYQESVAVENDDELDDHIVITLRKPIRYAEGDYAEITVREPTMGKLDEMAGKTGLVQMSIATGAPEGVLKQVGSRDGRKLSAALARFI